MSNRYSSMNSLGPWPWEGLNAFFATARTGSLSGAASSLGVSQPTVGRRIDALEAALGGALLVRLPGGCHPTALGEAILPHLEQIRLQGQRIRAAVQVERSDLRGIVRIATGPLVGQHLARHVDALLAGTTHLQLEIVPSMGFEELVRGKADIAVRTRPPDQADALARRLGLSPFAVFASESWLARHPIDTDRIPGGAMRWVGYLPSSEAASARWLRGRIGREADVRFGTSLSILEAVRSGVGLGVLPAFVGAAHPSLVRVGPILWDELCYESWMVRPASTADVPRIRAVAERLAQVMPAVERPGTSRSRP